MLKILIKKIKKIFWKLLNFKLDISVINHFIIKYKIPAWFGPPALPLSSMTCDSVIVFQYSLVFLNHFLTRYTGVKYEFEQLLNLTNSWFELTISSNKRGYLHHVSKLLFWEFKMFYTNATSRVNPNTSRHWTYFFFLSKYLRAITNRLSFLYYCHASFKSDIRGGSRIWC